MNTSELGKIWKTYQDLLGAEDKSELEDLKEYESNMLSKRYNLSKEGGQHLFGLIQHEFKTDVVDLYDGRAVNPLNELVTEFIHGDYEGYEDWEKVVVQKVINDLGTALYYWNK